VPLDEEVLALFEVCTLSVPTPPVKTFGSSAKATFFFSFLG